MLAVVSGEDKGCPPPTQPSQEAANRGRRTPHLRKLWLGRQFVRLVPYKLAILSVKYTFSVQGGIAPPLALSLAACGNVWKQPKRPFRKRKP
eukprot:1175847-Prorocentrum_minimum.AAC.3